MFHNYNYNRVLYNFHENDLMSEQGHSRGKHETLPSSPFDLLISCTKAVQRPMKLAIYKSTDDKPVDGMFFSLPFSDFQTMNFPSYFFLCVFLDHSNIHCTPVAHVAGTVATFASLRIARRTNPSSAKLGFIQRVKGRSV